MLYHISSPNLRIVESVSESVQNVPKMSVRPCVRLLPLHHHQYSTVRYSIVQYSSRAQQFCLWKWILTSSSRGQYSTVQYSIVQYSTVQYSKALILNHFQWGGNILTQQESSTRGQYSTVQYCTVQYSTVQYSSRAQQFCLWKWILTKWANLDRRTDGGIQFQRLGLDS